MSTTRPNRGAVAGVTVGDSGGNAVVGSVLGGVVGRAPKTMTRDGRWRPDVPFHGDHGVRITLRREPGVTTGNVLRVPFRFPVPVMNTFARSHQFEWSTYDTLRLGQRSRPDGRQLMQPQIQTMLMDAPTAHSTSGVVVWHGVADPQGMLAELRWIMGVEPGSQAQVFRLVLDQPSQWGHRALVNILATLVELDPSQVPGEVGTEYLSMTFLEYAGDSAGRKQRPAKNGTTKHRLRAGDTLYEIAKNSHFHAASAWRTIAAANGIVGVAPSSAGELAAWAKRHHKTQLTIPATDAAASAVGALVGRRA